MVLTSYAQRRVNDGITAGHPPTTRTETALLYVRISDARQSEFSIPTQIDSCRAYAAERGYVVAGVYNDGMSGAIYRERPALSELRQQVRDGGVDVVIAHAVDRLSRQQSHLYILMEEFAEHGCRLEFVTETFEDSAIGRLILSIRAFVGEVEREKIIERSTRGRRARAMSGKIIPTGRPLYGYQWRDEATKAEYDPNPLTAPVVQRIYREAHAGVSMLEIAHRLTQDGIPTPTGRARWAQSTVQWMLRHPSYGGQAAAWCWRPQGRARKNATYDAEQAIPLPPSVVPPLVDPRVWHDVQRTIERNRHRMAGNTSHADRGMLRGGYARCGHCGYPLYVSPSRGDLKYRCESRYRQHTDCTVHSIWVDELDAQVWEYVARIAVDESALAAPRKRTSTTPDVSAIEGRIAALERQQARLASRIAAVDDDALADVLTEQLRGIIRQRQDAEAERDALVQAAALRDGADQQRRDTVEWLRSVRARLHAMSIHERRLAVEMLDLEVRFYRAGCDPRVRIRPRALES